MRYLILFILLFTTTLAHAEDVKYVFLLIGDGTADAQLQAGADALAKESPGKKLCILQMPVQAKTTTDNIDGRTTDSAAAGTALATGHKTKNGRIARDADDKVSFPTLAELAAEKGRKIGILSSVMLNHATPASFYAHTASRNSYAEIAKQLVTSKVDFMGGGGLSSAKKGATQSDDPFNQLKKAGVAVLTADKAPKEIAALAKKQRIYLRYPHDDPSKAMPYAIERKDSPYDLPFFLTKAIEALEGSSNGFFIMVEGGAIDWACHANNLPKTVGDVIEFDRTVAVALEFAKKHPKETLVVVTGDHETGGLKLGKKGYTYSSRGHTSTSVNTSAAGVGAEAFKKATDNTLIPKLLAEAMGFKIAE